MAYGTVNVHISRSAGDVFAVGVGTTAREVSTFLGRRIEVDSVVTEYTLDE